MNRDQEKRIRIPLEKIFTWLIVVCILSCFLMRPVPDRIDVYVIAYFASLFLLITLYMVKVCLTGKIILLKSRILWALFIWMLMMGISSYKAFISGVSMSHFLRDVGPFFILVLAFPIAEYVKKSGTMVRINRVVLLGTVMLSAIVWESVFTHSGWVGIRSHIRANAPVVFMPLFLVGIAIAVSELKNATSRGKRLFWIFIIAELFAAVIFTFTRSLILSAFVTIFFAFLLSGKISFKNIFLKLVILCVVGSLFIGVLGGGKWIEEHFPRKTSLDTPGFHKRLGSFRNAMGLFAEAPFLGKGPGYVIELHMPEYNLHREKSYTHNFVTYIMVHYGSIGVMVMVWILISLFVGFWHMYRRGESKDMQKCAFASVIGLLGVFFYVQFQSVYKSFSFMMYLALLIGYAARMNEVMRNQNRRHSWE